MRNLSTWILVMFMVVFWIFRIIIAVTTEFGIDFAGMKALNMGTEVLLLFVALLCMLLVIKRNMIGALIYLVAYGIYFGTDLYSSVMTMVSGGTLSLEGYMNAFMSFFGVILPIAVLLDLLADKNRKANPKDKKTDWFYKNEAYDRKYDERADRNNYKF